MGSGGDMSYYMKQGLLLGFIISACLANLATTIFSIISNPVIGISFLNGLSSVLCLFWCAIQYEEIFNA